jgi:CheY-like chemotaxis protein
MNNAPKILIVDDEQEIVRGLTVRLHAAGYETVVAHNGADAISRLGRTRPDAILLDVRMPGFDGLTVLKMLQEGGDTRKVPVIMISASLSDEGKALSAGARFFLAKPYRGDELLRVIEQVTACSISSTCADPCASGRSSAIRKDRVCG